MALRLDGLLMLAHGKQKVSGRGRGEMLDFHSALADDGNGGADDRVSSAVELECCHKQIIS